MKTAVVFAALLACASAARMAPLLAESSPERVPREYVIMFEDDVKDSHVSDHLKTVQDLIANHGYNNTKNAILHQYHIGRFRGYGAKLDDKLRDSVRSMDHVKYVECSQYYHTNADCTLQEDATWGIVRTTFINKPTIEDYSYTSNAGEGVDIYIIDTGIQITHPDFGGRAVWGEDFIDNPSPRTDLNGHGTHVAGTVMSNTWGLAKKGTAIAVRVLNANGSGTTAGVIGGINWTANQHTSGKKSVANMSLGGGYSASLNNAVDAAVTKGVNFAVAAGNEYSNACSRSPASATQCVTVGASDSNDVFASFSNYGNCVDIIGPGVSITSTWINDGVNTISGTSMATPHVAGVMAKYLSEISPMPTPSQLKTLIEQVANQNKITNIPSGTPNLLIFKQCA